MARPEIAVVIPTFQREARLAFALDALAEQTLAASRFEVVVVRAAGASGELTTAPDGMTVRFETSPRASPAVQRNLGWRATSAPLVAFTDDDCRPQTTWLERLLAAAESGTVLQGRTEPDPDEAGLMRGLDRSMTVIGPHAWHPTCNIAYPRSLLERLGGFDEGFGVPWGEDTDLGLRALEAGAAHRYVDDAVVYHAVVPRSLAAAAREARRRAWIPLVVARHPEHRRALYAGWFLNHRHAKLLLALAGTLVARRRPGIALAAAMPYLADFRDALPPSPTALTAIKLPGLVAASTIVDLCEVGAVAAGSIRHRTLVL